MELDEKLADFYTEHLPGAVIQNTMLQAPCPFCRESASRDGSSLVAYLGARSYFAGYFRCRNRCTPGGYAPHFARLSGIDPAAVPGYDPDREPSAGTVEFPAATINRDIRKYRDNLTPAILDYFAGRGIGPDTLVELQIGYNGRYIVYPYFALNGNCYTAHCIMPDNESEEFWHGDKATAASPPRIFNEGDIDCCEDGAMFIVEGERNLLCLRELGFPGIAVPRAADLNAIPVKRFQYVRTLFIAMDHSPESHETARIFAGKAGFKVRLLQWPPRKKRGFNLTQLAAEGPENFREEVSRLVNSARAFSPFPSPAHEYGVFLENMERQRSESYQALQTDMPGYDKAVGGIYGINILGGPPKAGKSCFAIQLATETARKKTGVLYYDFENGTQKIYQRTLARLSRVPVASFSSATLEEKQKNSLAAAHINMQNLLGFFRVVNDRRINPDAMRRHVDFLRHETRRDDILVVIDSLHKLPFKDFAERRTGINAWLRELESIRDTLNVGFLVISELTRQEDGRYDGVPHMGLFKDSSDIEYTADNAMVFLPEWQPTDTAMGEERTNALWLVASREHSPGLIGRYRLDFPYWGFKETDDKEN